MLCDTSMTPHQVLVMVTVMVLITGTTVNCTTDCSGTGGCPEPAHRNGSDAPKTPYIQEITDHTAKPADKPQVLSMLADDVIPSYQHTTTRAMPTTTTSSMTTTVNTDPKGRALDFTVGDHSNGLSNATGVKDDLSNVNMDDDDGEDMPMAVAKILAPKNIERNSSMGTCEKGGLTYDNGEKLEIDCDTVCTCSNGKMDCADRCRDPFIRKGKKVSDPFCKEHSTEDPCCSVLQCAADTETEPLEICHYKNKTYNRGDIIQEGCLEVCTCEAGGNLVCKPRCSPITKPSDKCLEIPDKNDNCCKTVICDVTLKDNKLVAAKYINSTTIKLEFDMKIEVNQTFPLIDVSEDKSTWKTYTPLTGGYLSSVETNFKYAKIENTDDIIEVQNLEEYKKAKEKNKLSAKTCEYKGSEYKIGEEFNDKCESFCVCKESGVKCLKLECPTYFGTDVLDPNCIEWETVPTNFTPTPPKCCPEKLRCKSNGSCSYKGASYQNWQQVPSNVTGCEKRCYCEMGKVECQNICPPVTALPPANLECPPQHASLNHLPGDDCCVYWMCNEKDDINSTEQIKTGDNRPPDTIRNATDKPYIGPFNPLPTKQPSKVLGPLLVYANNQTVDSDLQNNLHTPFDNVEPTTILPDENHYYTTDKTKKPIEVGSPPYLGPFNPAFKQSSKPNVKVTKEKVKPNKNVFVTPPPYGFNEPNRNENGPIPNAPHIRIHGKGSPEELLHIINQHPEIANYPPGSVVEIHNIPHRPIPDYNNPNSINQGSHPYTVTRDNPNKNIPLPPGVTLEQILQEIHKSGQSNTILPYHQQNSLYPGNNGQIFLPPPHRQPINNGRPQQNQTGLSHPGMFPGGFPNLPIGLQPHDDINVHVLEALDAHTIRLAFTVPAVIVGLHGRVEVRYTHKEWYKKNEFYSDDDTNSWELQVFAPPNDLIATPQLEFDLVELKADTEYKIKITITLRDLHNTPTSRIYTIRTLKEVMSSTLPPMIPIEPDLIITDINATWVNVAWRKFTEYELQFIDGVQLRFKEIDGKIYAATPLIHRAVTSYTLENLKPNTKYEIGIFFIPFPGQHTELHAEHMLHYTTANEIDTYGFNVTLEITIIKPTNVEISWSGVPYPEDKYVNIYRAIYQSDSGKGDSSTFKVAKRDSPSKTSITDLKPGTRYRLWLEIYLTNGKIKTSNVQDFITKPRSAPSLGASSKQDKLSGELPEDKGDYYGPLVIVAILAAIAILSTLVLLLILVRRHSQNKACITPPPRVSQSAYDNPTYKVEIQQETMDL